MEPSPDGTQCYILRLPYEMLKHTLSHLDQRDQLSIAKTCVHLLEIAYPMAYHRIFVKTDPVTAMTVWRDLASGNGLRHVRHLQVHDSGRSSANATKPNHAGDVVTGILFTALPRHQLLSFSLTDSLGTSVMSTRNLGILVKTQQHLAQVILPTIIRPGDISMAYHLPVALQLRSLRSIMFHLPGHSRVDDMSSVIVQKSPSLKSIHLWFSFQGNKSSSHIFAIPTGGPSPRSVLFSVATRVTFHGYDFKHPPMLVDVPAFPALCALAMIDCKNDFYFYIHIKPARLPKLRALMITTSDFISGDAITHLIGASNCLRELIIDGPTLNLMNCSSLRSHAQSLELLFLGIQGTSLSSLTELGGLRHLGLSMDSLYHFKSTGFCTESKKSLNAISTSLASYKKLLSLTLLCTTYFILPRYPLAEEEIGLLSSSAHSEMLIRDELLSRMKQGGSMVGDSLLEFISVVVRGTAYTLDVPAEAIETLERTTQHHKTVLSVQPTQALRSADLVKEDMIARHAKDYYYFFDAYIDAMTKASRVEISSGSSVVANV